MTDELQSALVLFALLLIWVWAILAPIALLTYVLASHASSDQIFWFAVASIVLCAIAARVAAANDAAAKEASHYG